MSETWAPVSAQTSSDDQGAFELPRLPPAEYALWAAAPRRGSCTTTIVPLPVGGADEDVEVWLDVASDLRGDVSVGGERVAGVRVTMSPGAREAVTDDDGAFTFLGVCPGKVSFDVDDPRVALPFEATQVVVQPEHDERVHLEGVPVVVVRGRVEPEGHARVWMSQSKSATAAEESLLVKARGVKADADGSFELHGVPPGRWILGATRPDGAEGFVDLEIPPSGVDDLVIVTEPRASIRGTLVDQDDEAIAHATVMLSDHSALVDPMLGYIPLRETLTDYDGAFVLHGVRPGAKVLFARMSEGDFLAVPGSDGHTVEVDVSPEGVTGLRMRVRRPTGSVRGIVHAADGTPAVGARVELRDADAMRRMLHGVRWAPVVTGAAGRFAFEGIEPGSYEVLATSRDLDSSAPAVAVGEGDDVDLTLQPRGVLEGVVRRDGEAVRRFTVTVSQMVPVAVVSPDGSFRVERVDVGDHEVKVSTEVEPGVQAVGDATVDVDGVTRARFELAVRRPEDG